MPLSLLATLHPDIVARLAGQLAGDAATADGQFLLRQRPLDLPAATLPAAQRRLWEALAGGPVPASALPGGYANDRALARLIDRGLVIRAAMTPSDAAHVVGRQADWCREAARLGGMLLARQLGVGLTAEAVAERIIEQVIRQSAEALLDTAFGRWRPGEAVIEPGRPLIDEAIAGPQGRTTDLFTMAIALAGPIVAIGAPAGTYYPAVADRLGTISVVPPFAEVCNAAWLGTRAGRISNQQARAIAHSIPGHCCVCSAWRRTIVWASRKSSSRCASATTIAERPSGVKYRL